MPLGLGQNGPQFPFQQYLASRQASLPGTVAGQALGEINVPELIQLYRQETAKQSLLNALQGVRTGQMPNSSPDLTGGVASGPNQNYTPETQQQSQPSLGNLAALYQTAFPTQTNPYASAMANQLDPEKQANIRHLNAETEAIPGNSAANIAYKQAEVLNQQMQLAISKMMQEGRLEEAKQALEAKNQLGLMAAQIKAQAENAKHPIRNLFGMKPLVHVPESLNDIAEPTPAPGFGGQTGVKNFKRTPK